MTVTEERYVESEAPKYSYELSLEEVTRLTEELLRDREPVSDDRFVCYELDGSEATSNLGRMVEREVFERHFEGNDAEGMHDAYDLYEAQSTFFVTIDRVTKQPVGAVRVIRNGENGFKTLNDVAQDKNNPRYAKEVYGHYGIEDLSTCWDIATAAVRKGYGGGDVSAQVYRAMWVASQRKGIEHFFSAIDKKPYELMSLVGFPFEPLPGADWMPYIGSDSSLPVYGAAPLFEDAVRHQESQTDEELRPFLQESFRTLGYGDHDDALILR